MRITDEQKRNIYSLVCERLSANEDNLRYVEDFINYKNESLADTLKNEAFEEDEKGNIAYYLIKNPDGKVLFYFSLKCGSLYESIKGVDSLERIRELYGYVIELKNEPDLNESDRQAVESIIERIRTGKGLIKNDLAKISYAKKGEIIKELEKASEDDLKRVGKTFAGIEIVHFCTNDLYREIWNKFNIDQKLGVVVFWMFIVPKILEVMQHIGCEYIFLFAADMTPDEYLVNYYKTYLKFKDTTEHGTTMSLYDYGCKFMHQETASLKAKQEFFFEYFNHDEDAI